VNNLLDEVRMKKYFVIFAIIIIFFSVSQNAMSCSCGEPPPLEVEFKNTAVVFVGMIVKGEALNKIDGDYIDRKFTVEILNIIKGDVKDTVEIYTSNPANCGFTFIIGDRYLIYADYDEEKKLSAHLCSRTKEQGEIEPEEKLLFYKK
jgi:hypothetical protein